ncbi:MAG: thiolase family protein [Anaerolineales bacterium]|jgi:acetyl-CoA acyltransferase
MSNTPVIVSAVRTAVGKAKRGSLATVRPDELMATVIRELLQRAAPLEADMIDDVIVGCAMPEGEQGLNVGRIAALRAGLPVEVPGQTVNRFCSSGLQTIANAAMAIKAGMGEVIIAGGTESMSMVPMIGNKFAPNPTFAVEGPEVYLNMGLTAERVAEQYDVSREDQDAFALSSHQKAAAALEGGSFEAQIVPIEVELIESAEGKTERRQMKFEVDEGVRHDTSLESLARLKPVFKRGGTVTAGNASQMSDGAAGAVVMTEERAVQLGLTPLARFVAYGVGGVPPEIMGVGPIAAVPKALSRAGLTLDDMDLIELNEAFASQALAVIRGLEMDPERVNVNGGAIALGHPLGCTGAKLTTQILYEMQRRKSRYGMVTMCIGGGMGAAGIFENLN